MTTTTLTETTLRFPATVTASAKAPAADATRFPALARVAARQRRSLWVGWGVAIALAAGVAFGAAAVESSARLAQEPTATVNASSSSASTR